MKNAEYWAERMRILQEKLLRQGYDLTLDLERQFDRAIADVEKDMAKWFLRFAKNRGITLAEAKRILSTRELEEFRWTVEEYIEKGASLDPKWRKQLENASARVHISRYESLTIQLQQKAETLYGNQLDGLDRLLRGIYSEGYHRTGFEIQRGIGVGHNMMALDDRLLDKVLAKPWTTDKKTFRDRCWLDKEALVRSVDQHMTNMMLRGKGPKDAIAAISRDFKVGKDKSGRLVMTESAALSSACRQDCYRDLDVEKYQIVETLDEETCELCGELDGNVYDLSDYRVGATAPPFHPWCRGTDAPYFADMADVGERFAREGDGRNYYVPRDMTYERWKKKYVESPLTNAAGKPIIRVTRVDLKGPPNSITQRTNSKGGIDRNYYGADGMQSKQISNNGHGHKKEEAMGKHGEHAHDYGYDEDGKWKHFESRELTDTERGEESDIL